jgi:transglutaminase-like putative cysteine protease
MNKYLESTEYIDWKNPALLAQALVLSKDLSAPEKITQSCFEFVRDEIKHSWDYKLGPVTYKASDVLKYGTGFCYAKSHLLAALLRANNIPTGLCYQRLTITDNPPFCLHGLNAVYLEPFGWHRIDARGNKKGVSADFCPPIEKLAFPILVDGEADLPEIWTEPLSVVVQALRQHKTIQDVSDNLPDIHLITANKSIQPTAKASAD